MLAAVPAAAAGWPAVEAQVIIQPQIVIGPSAPVVTKRVVVVERERPVVHERVVVVEKHHGKKHRHPHHLKRKHDWEHGSHRRGHSQQPDTVVVIRR